MTASALEWGALEFGAWFFTHCNRRPLMLHAYKRNSQNIKHQIQCTRKQCRKEKNNKMSIFPCRCSFHSYYYLFITFLLNYNWLICNQSPFASAARACIRPTYTHIESGKWFSLQSDCLRADFPFDFHIFPNEMPAKNRIIIVHTVPNGW